jgi:hypothetical protein
MVNDALREIRRALRTLAKAPSFALIAVGTLGLAIGASAAIFTLVDTVLLDPLPYRDADRLVVLQGSAPGTDFDGNLAVEFFIEFKEQADLLENIAAYNMFASTLRTDNRVERVWMSSPTLSLFGALGVTPQLGRLPTSEEGPLAAVLSHELWMEWFGGDPNVIGHSYSMAGAMRTVSASWGPTSTSRTRTRCFGSRLTSLPLPSRSDRASSVSRSLRGSAPVWSARR